jgi:outer membrane murein-binding lipoprotein Lpp
MNRIVLALVALGSLALAGCQTLDSHIAQVSDRLSVDLFAPDKRTATFRAFSNVS